LECICDRSQKLLDDEQTYQQTDSGAKTTIAPANPKALQAIHEVLRLPD
jgi:hypothetical protein